MDSVFAQGGWLGTLSSWPATLHEWLVRDRAPVARVLIAGVKGSAPREPGACMLVSAGATHGTIGGGKLEWQAIAAARELLAGGEAAPPARIQPLVLGRELAQCCGGAVQLWLERFTARDIPLLCAAAQTLAKGLPVLIRTQLDGRHLTRELRPAREDAGLQLTVSGGHALLAERLEPATLLWLYGAGHVGQALVRILTELPFTITWIDSREGLLPEALPPQVRTLCAPDPVATVRLAPGTARFLVMTHDHALDYALCRAILERGAFAWLGLIGSRSKGARFRSRLAREGIAPAAIARLTSPIGLTSISSKLPAAIAVGVAAQLLQGLEPAAVLSSAARADRLDDDMREACAAPDCTACTAGRHP